MILRTQPPGWLWITFTTGCMRSSHGRRSCGTPRMGDRGRFSAALASCSRPRWAFAARLRDDHQRGHAAANDTCFCYRGTSATGDWRVLCRGAFCTICVLARSINWPPAPSSLRKYLTTDPRIVKLYVVDRMLFAFGENARKIGLKFRLFQLALVISTIATGLLGRAVFLRRIGAGPARSAVRER